VGDPTRKKKNKQTDQPKLTVNEEHEVHTRAVALKNKETLFSIRRRAGK
jgi:hypothetical protein